MNFDEIKKIISKQLELLADRSELGTGPEDLATLSEAMATLIRLWKEL